MDAKWGGAIVATLAGFGVWLCTRPKNVVKEAKASSRPPMDDFVERKILEMSELLAYLQQSDGKKYDKDKVEQAKKGMDKVVVSADKFRQKQGINLPPLKYGTWDEYKTRHQGGRETSGGPFNYLFETSGQLKSSTGYAMGIMKDQFPENHQFTDEEAYAIIRKIYDDPEVINADTKEGGLGGMTLNELAVELWNEQSTYKGRNNLRNQEAGLGYNLEAARKWIDAFFVQKTYEGFKKERQARKAPNSAFRTEDGEFHRYVGNFDKHNKHWKNVGLDNLSEEEELNIPFNLGEAEYASKKLDNTWKTDLIVRLRKGTTFSKARQQGSADAEGSIIMGGIQVKPLSFFKRKGGVDEQNWRHRRVSGIYTDTQKNEHPTTGSPLPKTWRQPVKIKRNPYKPKYDQQTHKMIRPEGIAHNHFYVQNLIYGTDGEWLNYESVLKRLEWNIPDPISTEIDYRNKLIKIQGTSIGDNTEERDANKMRLLKDFVLECNEWTDMVVDKLQNPTEEINRYYHRGITDDWREQATYRTPRYKGIR